MSLMLKNISYAYGAGLCTLSVVSAFVWDRQPLKETGEPLASSSVNGE